MTVAGAAARAAQGDIAFQEKLYVDPNPTRRGLHLGRRNWVETQLDQLLTPQSIVLEVGVGCGIFTRFLAERSSKVIAIDINPAFLEGVENMSGVSVSLADATLDQGVRDVDVALCSEVLEHVPPERSQAMLDQFFAALKSGGTLILTTPQRYASVELMARLFKFKAILALARMIYGTAEELGHINLLTRSQLRAQIARAGFRIEEQELLGFYLPAVAELGGAPGAALLHGLGSLLRPIPFLRGLLWTQAYRLVKP